MHETSAELVDHRAPSEPPSSNTSLRRVCNFLRLPLLCGKASCRRRGECRGAPRECMTRLSPLVPEEARMYLAGLWALRDSGLRFEDEHWKLWEEERAFNAWVATIERARGVV
jgi:hypothetical protein